MHAYGESTLNTLNVNSNIFYNDFSLQVKNMKIFGGRLTDFGNVKQNSEVNITSSKEDVNGDRKAVSDDPKEMAKRFKKSFSREVQVHFVGAWSVLVCLIFRHSNS